MAESSQPPVTPSSAGREVSDAVRVARAVLAEPPAGLLTDFDGTLSPIVGDPSLARLVDGARSPLARLAEQLAVVAIVTGRAASDARALVDVPGLLVAGNHGIEWLEPGRDASTMDPGVEPVTRRLADAVSRVPRLEGTFVEEKGPSATIHYRHAPDTDRARATIVAALGDPGDGIEVRYGRMSVELRAPRLGDKGSAAREIMERYGLRGVVVMGDDVTDLDMFRAVAEARGEGRVNGLIVGVGGADREVPDEVIAAADVVLATPEEAAALLAGLADAADADSTAALDAGDPDVAAMGGD